jgi:hypothetical protein
MGLGWAREGKASSAPMSSSATVRLMQEYAFDRIDFVLPRRFIDHFDGLAIAGPPALLDT